MAWEERQRGGRYYYQSVREAGEVRKKYIGVGEVAELIAHADDTMRRHREELRARAREELERMRGLVSGALELDEAVDALLRAHLVAAGCHRHKGVWRRGRNT
jgi:hypothetical protein